MDKHSSLLCLTINDRDKMFYKFAVVLIFLNLPHGLHIFFVHYSGHRLKGIAIYNAVETL